MKKKSPERKLAERIAKRLFVNGCGHKASRLVLEDVTRPFDAATNKRSAGGWCLKAATDQIECVLQEDSAE